MRFLIDFMQAKVPRGGAEQPVYYRIAFKSCSSFLALYFLLSFVLIAFMNPRNGWHIWMVIPLIMAGAMAVFVHYLDHMSTRLSLGFWALVTCSWSYWYIYMFGWGVGAQHFLIPLLMLVFFDIYETPYMKVFYFFAIIIFRMLIYAVSLGHEPVVELSTGESMLLQILNSFTSFLILAFCCIIFSTNLQATERKLRLDNEELQKEAGTDPLTQLPNRRAMLDVLEQFEARNPNENYCVAIADIDFFKKVNDTYGHNCGDYTLKMLADLFREKARCNICRWGGEEFFFFLPDQNLDEAAQTMQDICIEVRKMNLSFEGNEFCITITVGVAENDFVSPMSAIMEEADRKLYLGKNQGRDRVVV